MTKASSTTANQSSIDMEKELFLAAEEGNLDKLRHLVEEKQISVDLRDADMRTPLHWACVHKKEVAVLYLLDHGASVNTSDESGWTPLISVASCGHGNIFRLLCLRGSDINAKTSQGTTALHYACSRGYKDICESILGHKEMRIINAKDKSGSTALHRAVTKGSFEIVQLLLEHGADFEIQDLQGDTPLHIASSEGHVSVVKLLLDAGASLEVINRDEKTPLAVATEPSVIHLLRAFKKTG